MLIDTGIFNQAWRKVVDQKNSGAISLSKNEMKQRATEMAEGSQRWLNLYDEIDKIATVEQTDDIGLFTLDTENRIIAKIGDDTISVRADGDKAKEICMKHMGKDYNEIDNNYYWLFRFI